MKLIKTTTALTLLICPLLLTGCSYEMASTVDLELPTVAVNPEKAEDLCRQGKVYSDNNQLEAAIASFGFALEENPNLTEAHLGMGHAYRIYGSYNVAENAYTRAVKSNPQNYDANYYLGLSYQMQDKIQRAIKQYLRAIIIDPNRVEANRDIASAYLEVGAPQKALDYALKATKADPTSQVVWINLAATANLLGKYDVAVEAYREAAELAPLTPELIPSFANAHIKLKNYTRARNLLEPLIASSDSPSVIERYAYVLFKLKQYPDAMAYYNHSLSINPNHIAALNGKGACFMTLYVQGDRTDNNLKNQAFTAWRKSLKLEPRQPRIVDLLSRYNHM